METILQSQNSENNKKDQGQARDDLEQTSFRSLHSESHSISIGYIKNKNTHSEEEAAAALLLAAGGKKASRRGSHNSTETNPVCYVSPVSSSNDSHYEHHNNNNNSHSHMQMQMQHFPSQLHEFLSGSEHAGVVAEWLPHGLSWRVLRWEALKTDVLQKYFPQCIADPDGFTWQVNAWGFEEIRSGPDRGSFRHEVSKVK